MGVDNKNSINNDKYSSLTELKKTIISNVEKLNEDEKDFELFTKISEYFSLVEIFQQNDYKRGEVRKKISDIYQNILSKINLDELISFNINKGILVLNYRNLEKDYKNLIFSEEKGQEYINELKKTGKITIQDLDELSNQINKEKLLGGAVLVSYCALSGTGNHFFIDRITIKLSDGVTKSINITNGGINYGTKELLKSNLLKILEKEGILFDAKKFSFYRIENTKIGVNINKELSKISYEKYKELTEINGEKPLNKQEFEGNREKIKIELNKSEIKFSNYKKFQELFGKYGFGPIIQHALFLPIFFKTYHSQTSDLASLGKSLSEWGLFTAGAKLGLGIASKIKNPMIAAGTGIILSLGLGVGSIVTGEKLGEKFELDKKFWKLIPDREDYWEKKGLGKGKSFLAHFATLGPVNGLVDYLGTDFKIPWTPISFIKTSVNVNTDIRGYMSSAVGRDKNFWNKRVLEYSHKLTEDIISLVEKYNGIEYYPTNIDDFLGEEQEKIQKSLEKKLLELKKSLASKLEIGTGKNEKIKETIYYGIIGLIEDGRFNENKKTIGDIVSMNVSKLKIDENYIGKKDKDLFLQDFLIKTFLGLNEDIKGDLRFQKTAFEYDYDNPLKGLNEEETSFCRKLYQRIVNHERMIEPDVNLPNIKIKNHKLTKNQYYKDIGFGIRLVMKKSKDKIFFEKLIENDNFLHFLNTMVEYKRDKDFLTNIKKTGYAVEWDLI